MGMRKATLGGDTQVTRVRVIYLPLFIYLFMEWFWAPFKCQALSWLLGTWKKR